MRAAKRDASERAAEGRVEGEERGERRPKILVGASPGASLFTLVSYLLLLFRFTEIPQRTTKLRRPGQLRWSVVSEVGKARPMPAVVPPLSFVRVL